jgi:hypothetical protein
MQLKLLKALFIPFHSFMPRKHDGIDGQTTRREHKRKDSRENPTPSGVAGGITKILSLLLSSCIYHLFCTILT